MTLQADVNHPESQEDVISNWDPAHSLVEDAVSGAEIAAAPCLPALMSNACLSASREGWPYMGAGLLSFAICLILCSVSTPRVTMPGGISAFHGNGLLFIYLFIYCLSGDPTVWVAVLH